MEVEQCQGLPLHCPVGLCWQPGVFVFKHADLDSGVLAFPLPCPGAVVQLVCGPHTAASLAPLQLFSSWLVFLLPLR